MLVLIAVFFFSVGCQLNPGSCAGILTEMYNHQEYFVRGPLSHMTSFPWAV